MFISLSKSHYKIEDRGIRFFNYPFSPASVRKKPFVKVEDIQEILLERHPPELWLNNGEILFFTVPNIDQITRFAEKNNIKLTSRCDIWELINRDFLDTEYTEQENQFVLSELNDCGLTVQEVESIRRQISKRMLFINAYVWEWMSLGHFDLLLFHKSVLFWNRKKFKRFYDFSIEIARRGC